MYYVLGSHELVAPASAGAPPLPAQPCTQPKHSRVLHAASFAVQFFVRPPRAPPLTPKRSLTGGILRVRDV